MFCEQWFQRYPRKIVHKILKKNIKYYNKKFVEQYFTNSFLKIIHDERVKKKTKLSINGF